MKNKKRAFILLFSLLISSVILAAGLAVTRIMIRQIYLASIQKDSQMAFFAADAGIECARYLLDFPVASGNPAKCNGQDLKKITDRTTVSGISVNGDNFFFDIGGGEFGGVEITKSCINVVYCSDGSGTGDCNDPGSPAGKIVSRGYNVECDQTKGTPVEGRVVERKLVYRYAP